MLNKMLMNLLFRPLLVAFGALLSWVFFEWIVLNMLAEEPLFAQVAIASRSIAMPTMLCLCVAALIYAAVQWRELRRWEKGGSPTCYACGGLAALRDGRYGDYYKCYACGAKRKA